jgi:hypothetical protein
MRPPKDPNDFSTHVARKDDALYVYCVECERWTRIVVACHATAIYRQGHWPAKTEDANKPSFHCGIRGCFADVGYLLNEKHQTIILDLADVPISRKRKVMTGGSRPVARQMQLRMAI